MIRRIAESLSRLARHTLVGGWSTDGLETMQQMAGDIYAYLGRRSS